MTADAAVCRVTRALGWGAALLLPTLLALAAVAAR